MPIDKLVYMANQIGRFFVSEDRATAIAAITDHLDKFWDPRMRAAIIAHARAGGADLAEPVRQAVLLLPPREPAPGNR